jgi:hypothetical protein
MQWYGMIQDSEGVITVSRMSLAFGVARSDYFRNFGEREQFFCEPQIVNSSSEIDTGLPQ